MAKDKLSLLATAIKITYDTNRKVESLRKRKKKKANGKKGSSVPPCSYHSEG